VRVPDPAQLSRCQRSKAAVVALLLLGSLAACSGSDVDQTRPGGRYEFTGATPAGQVIEPYGRAAAPDFSGELLDGTAFDSADLAGSVAVINFWGSWCAPCRLETPDFQEVYADVRDEGVRFLGVDVKDQRELGTAFLADVGAEYPSLFDPRGEVGLAFRGFPANVVPSTILLDREGQVAAVYTGAVTGDDLRSALAGLLREAGA
jgi:thiol-disulfide isomerase/thioredoxin